MCGCDPPYKLYCFPSELRNSQRRQAWIKLLRREGKNKTNWKPCGSDRVCSNHFVDSVPTPANPDPTINIGYEKTTRKQASRREFFRRPPTFFFFDLSSTYLTCLACTSPGTYPVDCFQQGARTSRFGAKPPAPQLTLNLKPITTGTSDEDIPSSSEAASTSLLLSPVLSDHSYIKTDRIVGGQN